MLADGAVALVVRHHDDDVWFLAGELSSDTM